MLKQASGDLQGAMNEATKGQFMREAIEASGRPSPNQKLKVKKRHPEDTEVKTGKIGGFFNRFKRPWES